MQLAAWFNQCANYHNQQGQYANQYGKRGADFEWLNQMRGQVGNVPVLVEQRERWRAAQPLPMGKHPCATIRAHSSKQGERDKQKNQNR